MVSNGPPDRRLGSMMISAEQQQWIGEQVAKTRLDKSKVVRAAIDAARANPYFDPVEITYRVGGDESNPTGSE